MDTEGTVLLVAVAVILLGLVLLFWLGDRYDPALDPQPRDAKGEEVGPDRQVETAGSHRPAVESQPTLSFAGHPVSSDYTRLSDADLEATVEYYCERAQLVVIRLKKAKGALRDFLHLEQAVVAGELDRLNADTRTRHGGIHPRDKQAD